MNKSDRHSLIMRIIEEKQIETQTQLIDELKKQGVHLAQATISRDIKELNIVKSLNSKGVSCYTLLADNAKSIGNYLKEVLLTYANSITQVGFLNIIRTELGAADVIAAEIDEKETPEIIGTLAGTDTIVLISKTEEEATIVNLLLSSFMNGD